MALGRMPSPRLTTIPGPPEEDSQHWESLLRTQYTSGSARTKNTSIRAGRQSEETNGLETGAPTRVPASRSTLTRADHASVTTNRERSSL